MFYNDGIHYDLKPLLDRGAFLNMVVGERGVGKTFAVKSYILEKAYKDRNKAINRNKFVYLRRYSDELKQKDMKKLFLDVLEENPELKKLNITMKYNAGIFYIIDSNGDEYEVGYTMALSKQSSFKSIPYNDVSTVLFDEFLIKPKRNRRYLNSEIDEFNEFINTVARARKSGIKIIMLGNAITKYNPYFLHYGIRLKPDTKFIFFKSQGLVVEYTDYQQYREYVKDSLVYKLNAGTDYNKYAFENAFVDDDESNIDKKPANAIYRFMFHYNNMQIGFWIDYKEGRIYASKKYNAQNPWAFAITTSDMKINYMLAKSMKNNYRIQQFMTAFEYNYLWYEDLNLKNACMDIYRILKGW